ncbi:MAG: serine--tRNA ligase, partial [Nitrosopumilales archaeon CG15_BIG_FIL_POST_REV_8_21_14_020_37_12]
MLDPKIIKENSQMVRDMLKARAVEFDLDALIDFDQKRREFIIKTDELRKNRNQRALEISQKKKSGDDASQAIAEMKSISEELSEL